MRKDTKKVKIKNKEFIVIPEAKMIKGKMVEKNYENDLKIGIKPIYKGIIRSAIILDFFSRKNNINKTEFVEATAYCGGNDEWDEKRGIEVCSAKMELKNHIRLAKLYNRISRILQEAAVIAQTFCIKHDKKAEAIEDDMVRTFGRLPL